MNTNTHPVRSPRAGGSAQAGVMLLEALVAILIFSLGVLSVIQLQAVSVRQASGAEYRSTASLLANDLVSRMWASDKTYATLQTVYASSYSGSGYKQWLATVQNSGLPNVSSDQETLPTVALAPIPSTLTGAPSTQATITIYWREPGDKTTRRSYQVVAQLK